MIFTTCFRLRIKDKRQVPYNMEVVKSTFTNEMKGNSLLGLLDFIWQPCLGYIPFCRAIILFIESQIVSCEKNLKDNLTQHPTVLREEEDQSTDTPAGCHLFRQEVGLGPGLRVPGKFPILFLSLTPGEIIKFSKINLIIIFIYLKRN